MAQETLYKECPLCNRGPVGQQGDSAVYRCGGCGLTLKERSLWGWLKKGQFSVSEFGEGDFKLAGQSLKRVALPAEVLKVVLGNVYTDSQLAAIANGAVELIRPVRTILAQVILEQLNETCHLQVNGLRRGHGAPLEEAQSHYTPTEAVPQQGMTWQDRGNLFCTNQRLVFPSDTFTFIRMDRKVMSVRAFNNGLGVQRRGEAFATYFVGCYPHEAAVVAAYVLTKLPALREPKPELMAEGKQEN